MYVSSNFDFVLRAHFLQSVCDEVQIHCIDSEASQAILALRNDNGIAIQAHSSREGIFSFYLSDIGTLQDGVYFVCHINELSHELERVIADIDLPEMDIYNKCKLFSEPIRTSDRFVLLYYDYNSKQLMISVCSEESELYVPRLQAFAFQDSYIGESRVYTIRCPRFTGDYIGIGKKDADNVIPYSELLYAEKCYEMKVTLQEQEYIDEYSLWAALNGKHYRIPISISGEAFATTCNNGNRLSIGVSFRECSVCGLDLRYEQDSKHVYMVMPTEVIEYVDAATVIVDAKSMTEKIDLSGKWSLSVVVSHRGQLFDLPVEADSAYTNGFPIISNDFASFSFVNDNGHLCVQKTFLEGKKKWYSVPEEFPWIGVSPEISGEVEGIYKIHEKAIEILIYENISEYDYHYVGFYDVTEKNLLGFFPRTSVDDEGCSVFALTDEEMKCVLWYLPYVRIVSIGVKNNTAVCRWISNKHLEPIRKDGRIFDRVNRYLSSDIERDEQGDTYAVVPYYADNGRLSVKMKRSNQVFRDQLSCRILDVRITKQQLLVRLEGWNVEGVLYKGILLEYRAVDKHDREEIFIPYDSMERNDDFTVFEAHVDLKSHYLKMLYWDIRAEITVNNRDYAINCYSNDTEFLAKYHKAFLQMFSPSRDSVLFPYATNNSSVALMHREKNAQDNWRFRVKEKVAQKIYQKFQPRFDSKNIVLFFEKYCTMAQDNGYYFFKYCVEHDFDKQIRGKLYYVIDAKADDRKKIEKYKGKYLRYLSLKHLIYLQACTLMISTDSKGHAYVWRSAGSDIKDLTYKKELVFLQHGVIGFKKVHFEKNTNVGVNMFITSSDFERGLVENDQNYHDGEVVVTGLARWDVLRDCSQGNRCILLMPTWRNWLDDAEKDVFAESEYCRTYLSLLQNPYLADMLKKKDVKLKFYIHPKFKRYISEFSTLYDNIELIPFGQRPLNELMMESNLLITDYSSVAWDFYYMGKPVLFYQFDYQKSQDNLGFYMNMEKDLFGERSENLEELISQIEASIDNGFVMEDRYLNMRDYYFKYIDHNNCKRIADVIVDRYFNH